MSQSQEGHDMTRAIMAQSNPSSWHTVALCSPFRTECGYCHGDRLSVLTRENPHPSPIGEPNIKLLPIEETHTNPPPSGITSSSTSTSSSHGNIVSQDESKQTTMQSTESPEERITPKTTSDSYALHFKNISPQAYLTLIDRGWRRSGKLVYLPKNWESCCAAIPIRLETSKFTSSKSQRKALKRLKQALGTKLQLHEHEQTISRRGGDWSKSEASSCKRQKQQLNGKGWIQHVEAQARALLQECGLQDTLQKGVIAQVNDILSQEGHDNIDLDKMQEKSGAIENMCSFKCAKFSKPQKLSSTGPQLVSIDVTLSSMVCPALHGKSKGQIDRQAIGQQIVEALRKLQTANTQNRIRIKTVHLHEKSGHINVIVDVTFEDVITQISSPGTLQDISTKKPAIDIIAEYIKSTSILSKSEQDALSPPYRLSVRSISSDVSGCMPQVHRLYFKYQQTIHGDEDPYVGAAVNMAAMDEQIPVDSTVSSEPS